MSIPYENLNEMLKGDGPPPIDWLVHGFLPRYAFLMWLSGEGVGKSFLAYDLAIAVSTGGFFLNFPCVQGPVLYFDEENAKSVVWERIYKIANGRNISDLSELHLARQHMVGRPVRDWVKDMEAECKRVQPALVVLDTYSSFYGPPTKGMENDSSMMKGLLSALRWATIRHGATLLVLHHIPKDGWGRTSPRGSGAIGGDVDGYWSLTNTKGRPPKNSFRTTVLHPEKNRILDGVPTMKISLEKLGKVGVKVHAEFKE